MDMNFAINTTHTPTFTFVYTYISNTTTAIEVVEIDTPMLTCVQRGEVMTYFNAHTKVSG
jgi:hypothetical protein